MTFEEWRIKYWKTDVPAEIKFSSAYDAGRADQNAINKDYYQAVDDALVCWEMTTTGNAKVDLNNLICMEQQVCLDPAVSLDARTLIRLGRLEAGREVVEAIRGMVITGSAELQEYKVLRILDSVVCMIQSKFGLEI